MICQFYITLGGERHCENISPENTTQWPWLCLQPGSVDPESNALIIRSLPLSSHYKSFKVYPKRWNTVIEHVLSSLYYTPFVWQCITAKTNTNKQHLFIFRKIFKFLNHNSLGFIVKFFQGFIVNYISNKRMLIKKKQQRACELHYMDTAM